MYAASLSDNTSWQPLIFDRGRAEDRAALEELFARRRVWQVYDTIAEQLRDLIKTRLPGRALAQSELDAEIEATLAGASLHDYGRWVYYPWSGRLVHLLPPAEFRQLRLDRNRNKITRDEQARLASLSVGIVGLSVGNAVALTLALEGACGHLKLADFDRLDLSNMNRIRAGVHDVGLAKTVLAARQIYELDPYASLELFDMGLTDENIDAFLRAAPPVDILIDECDGLDMKVLLRERARALGIPVLMETSDHGMLDVERFDLEPDRPLFHGLAGDLDREQLRGLSTEEKVPVVLALIGARTMSTRLGASLVEIDRTVTTWPQLGSEVALGGATAAAAVRRIGLGQALASGRRYIDVQAILDAQAAEQTSRAARASDDDAFGAPADIPTARLAELTRFVLEHAILAPSGGNVQPWRFHADDETIWFAHDRQRSKNLLDVGYRASYLAIGAAIENATIAAAHRGRRAVVELFPRGTGSDVVAKLRLLPGAGPSESRLAEWFEQLGRRATNRRLGERQPLRDDELAELRAAAEAPGVTLRLRTSDADLAEAGHILGAGDRLRYLCRELHGEAMAEIRWSDADARRTRDGIDIATLELSEKDAAAMRVLARPDIVAFLRAQEGGIAIEEQARKSLAAASAVGLVAVDRDDPAAFVAGGRAVQRIWLAATRLGLALQPMTALIYMFEMLQGEAGSAFTGRERETVRALEGRLDRLFEAPSNHPRMLLFRLSRAPEPSVRALRLPLDRVLAFGPPA